MKSIAYDIKDLLHDAGVGVFAASAGWGIFIDHEPAEPQTCITIYGTGGSAPSRAMLASVESLHSPSFQVRVRGMDYATAQAKMVECVLLLDKHARFVAKDGTTHYLTIAQTMEERQIEITDNKRHVWVAEFRAVRRAA